MGQKVNLLDVDQFPTTVRPVLTVRNASEGVAFYKQALGAEVIFRSSYADGAIVAEIAIGEACFRVANEAPEATDLSPQTLDGTSVRSNVLVADPDVLVQRAIASGVVEVAPIADQRCGLRQGRLADPYGHHRLIGRPLTDGTGDWVRSVGSR
ncbi:MAG TPA: VOC family protein [Candidatus Dormibacteraeota bacterium]|nr:VOC family protein [Candidatus Dormibacteraeota bacterium]